MSRRLLLAVTAIVVFVAGVAVPARSSTEVAVRGSRVLLTVPVDATGALDAGGAADALARQAEALASRRLYGCAGLEPEVVPAPAEPGAHRLHVLPQRPGQFVRTTVSGGADPFAGPQELIVGEQALLTESPLDGAMRFLLVERGTEIEGGLPGLVDHLVEHTDTTFRLKPCRWTGTLEIVTEFDRYNLRVTSEVDLSFTVDATGFVEGNVPPASRSATAEDPEVGACSGSGLELFRIGLTGSAAYEEFVLRFEPKGREPDFTLSCSGGTAEFGGDYIRAAFLPTGRLAFEMRIRDGATATRTQSLQGREVTARLTIRRG